MSVDSATGYGRLQCDDVAVGRMVVEPLELPVGESECDQAVGDADLIQDVPE
jgi:hypothetical protein